MLLAPVTASPCGRLTLTPRREGLEEHHFSELLFKNTSWALPAAHSLLGLPGPQGRRWGLVGPGTHALHQAALPSSECQPPVSHLDSVGPCFPLRLAHIPPLQSCAPQNTLQLNASVKFPCAHSDPLMGPPTSPISSAQSPQALAVCRGQGDEPPRPRAQEALVHRGLRPHLIHGCTALALRQVWIPPETPTSGQPVRARLTGTGSGGAVRAGLAGRGRALQGLEAQRGQGGPSHPDSQRAPM